MTSLAETLDRLTKTGVLFIKEEDNVVRCHACAHRCKLQPGKRGICQMRVNQDGILSVPWGYVSAANLDPIEKKPFAHFLPGSDVLTFGMLGCNFHCDFCQNWVTSQTLRDPQSNHSIDYVRMTTPEQIVSNAKRNKAKIIASSYNEPVITTEWAVDIFKLAKKEGMRCAYVSNGYASQETLEYLQPYLDAYKVDLKSMNEETYKTIGGKLSIVLETIQKLHEMGIWVEVVTLVIPGYNDSPKELWETARFICSVSRNIPWHVTAFHPDYKMTTWSHTTAKHLQLAADIGQEAGLNYVYAGNLPGKVGSLEDTHCPNCQAAVIKRRGYTVMSYALTAEGKCSHCGTPIAGIWTEKPEDVTRDFSGSLFQRW